MPPSQAELTAIAALPAEATLFVLVLCRVGGAVMVMPALGEQTIPMTIRAGIALCLTLLILPLAQPAFPIHDGLGTPGPIAYIAMIAVELFAGITIGWIARLITMALPIAGQIISLMTGLSSVLQPDPELGSGSAAPSRLLNLLAPVALLISGAWVFPIQAVIGSYTLLPPGANLFTPTPGTFLPDATHGITIMTEQAFTFGLELAAPFLLISVTWQIMLGLLGKLVTNFQVYTILSPLQMLGGIALFALFLREILIHWESRVLDVLHTLPGL